MYLNEFSPSLEPLDLTQSPEFASLCRSADDLGIARPRQVTYTSNNTVLRHQRFHFLSWGSDGTPIVVLHGSNQSSHSWDLVSLNLSKTHRVLALDQRGHGDSEWNRGAHYDAVEMAHDAAAFVERYTDEAPVLIGHSLGGMVALNLAVRYPGLVRALVIVDMGPEVSDEGREMISKFLGRNIEFDDMETFLDRVAEYDPYRSREHIARTLKYNLIRRADGKYVTKADRRRYVDARSPAIPAWQALEAIDVPVLIVRGADSNVLTADAAQRFAKRLPQGQYVDVTNCGHNVAQQNTPGFLAALEPYLASLTSP